MSEAYVVTCNNITWHYPQFTWFQNTHIAAVITNTLLCIPAIYFGYKNCKVLVQLGTQHENAATNLVLLSSFVTDVVTACTMLFIWNAQYIMSLFRYTSCPVSFFTYLITMVCTFVGALTTILQGVDRYLMVNCPFLYDQHVSRSLETYGKILAYIFVIALMLTGVGFSMSPTILYLMIIVLILCSILWGTYAYASLYMTSRKQNPTMTSYELRKTIEERRRDFKITKLTAANNVIMSTMMTPYYVLTCFSLYERDTLQSDVFSAVVMWSWVLISVKVAVTPLLFYNTLRVIFPGSLEKNTDAENHTNNLLT